MATATLIAYNGLVERLQAGEVPRREFLDLDSQNADVAHELLEAALNAARRSHERVRAFHYGTFWVNLVYAPDVDLAQAVCLLGIAERLTLRQWCVLQYVREHEPAIPLPPKQEMTSTTGAAWFEAQDLFNLKLLAQRQRENPRKDSEWPAELSTTGENLRALLALGELAGERIAEEIPVVLQGVANHPTGGLLMHR